MSFFKKLFTEEIFETPGGIITSDGLAFSVNKEGIERVVPGIFSHFSLQQLINDTRAWMQFPAAFGMLLFYGLWLGGFGFVEAVLGSFGMYLFLEWQKKAFIFYTLRIPVRIIAHPISVYGLAIVFFSRFGINGLNDFLIYGLLLFFSIKVGILPFLFRFIKKNLNRRSEVSAADAMLRMLLLKYALASGLHTKQTKAMEDKMFELYHYERKKK